MKYVEILSALLTPFLALLTGYIAFRQWRTEDLKAKHDLYERRLAIYNALMQFFGVIIRNAAATEDEMREFLQKTR